MSILAMTAARVEREIAEDEARRGEAAEEAQFGRAHRDPGTREAQSRENVLSQLLRYTPEETVGAYVLVLSLLPSIPSKSKVGVALWQYDFTWRWVLFLIFALVLTPAVVVGVQRERYRDANRAFQMPWFEIWVAAIAFSAWGLALPLAPLSSWHSWDQRIGVIIAVVALLVISTVTRLAGRASVPADSTDSA